MKNIELNIFANYPKIFKTNMSIYSKNIFYIILLINFEDLDFFEYINLSNYRLEWIVHILVCLGLSKCSDKFVNKFIHQIYLMEPLNKRINKIESIWYDISPKPYKPLIVKLISKLSFYEKKKFIQICFADKFSPTQLIINNIGTYEEFESLAIKNNCWEWIIDLFNSKYINIDKLINILQKIISRSRPENTFELKSKINQLINLSIRTLELSESYEYNINLLGYLILIYDHWLKIPFCDFLDHLATTHFLDKIQILKTILSNTKLIDKLISTLSEDHNCIMKEIIGLFVPNTNLYKYIDASDKENITNSFIKFSLNKYIHGYAFQYLIKTFKLGLDNIQTIFTYIGTKNIDIIFMLRKKHFIHMKNYLIDLNGHTIPDLKPEFFKMFNKYKLLTPNEIKQYILTNISHFNYWQIKKYIKLFEKEYIDALTENITRCEKCLFILSDIYKYVNYETINNTFKLLLEKNDISFLYYNIITSAIKKYPIKQIQNMFISHLENHPNIISNWIVLDVFDLCFISNSYDHVSSVLTNFIIKNKVSFDKETFIKYTNLYKVD